MKKIIELSKDIAKRLLNDEELRANDLDNIFSKDDAEDIVSNLSEKSRIKERNEQIEAVNKSKYKDWKKINKNTPYTSSQRHLLYKVAAVFIAFLSIGYFTYKYQDNLPFINNENNIVEQTFDDIILDFGDGKTTALSDTNNNEEIFENNVLFTKNGNAFQLDYTSVENIKIPTGLVYNQLNVPYGRRMQIVLSDGTKVNLNSGSKLKYPIRFIENEKRMVFLEGEGYFEVTKNKEQPFIVNANNMNVEVLGTIFNIMAYPEDSSITTILLEGSVAVSSNDLKTSNERTLLKPNQQALWQKSTGIIEVKPVKPNIYTAWTKGRTVFEHMTFKNILKKLERKYNVKITNNNEPLANEKFTATFDYENINQVLTSFSRNYPFDFIIKGNEITIN